LVTARLPKIQFAAAAVVRELWVIDAVLVNDQGVIAAPEVFSKAGRAGSWPEIIADLDSLTETEME
jgi:hypothetical protein